MQFYLTWFERDIGQIIYFKNFIQLISACTNTLRAKLIQCMVALNDRSIRCDMLSVEKDCSRHVGLNRRDLG